MQGLVDYGSGSSSDEDEPVTAQPVVGPARGPVSGPKPAAKPAVSSNTSSIVLLLRPPTHRHAAPSPPLPFAADAGVAEAEDGKRAVIGREAPDADGCARATGEERDSPFCNCMDTLSRSAVLTGAFPRQSSAPPCYVPALFPSMHSRATATARMTRRRRYPQPRYTLVLSCYRPIFDHRRASHLDRRTRSA